MKGLDTAVAIITGLAALISAVVGVTLAIHAARNKERKASKEEIDTLSSQLVTERDLRVRAELDRHNLRIILAQHGIDPDQQHDQSDHRF